MTRESCDRVKDMVEALREGRFDTLTPDQMEAAECHLNECEDCAAIVTGAVASPRAPLERDTATPSAGVWGPVWHRIDVPVAAANGADHRERTVRSLRLWTSLSAAAVVMLAAILWVLWPQTPTSRSTWELRLAGQNDVSIESVETYGTSTVFVVDVGDADGTSIVWLMEDQEISL